MEQIQDNNPQNQMVVEHASADQNDQIADGQQPEAMYAVQKILDHNLVRYKRNNQNYSTYLMLVKWDGYGDEDNTWEPLSTLIEDVQTLVQSYLKSKDLQLLYNTTESNPYRIAKITAAQKRAQAQNNSNISNQQHIAQLEQQSEVISIAERNSVQNLDALPKEERTKKKIVKCATHKKSALNKKTIKIQKDASLQARPISKNSMSKKKVKQTLNYPKSTKLTSSVLKKTLKKGKVNDFNKKVKDKSTRGQSPSLDPLIGSVSQNQLIQIKLKTQNNQDLILPKNTSIQSEKIQINHLNSQNFGNQEANNFQQLQAAQELQKQKIQTKPQEGPIFKVSSYIPLALYLNQVQCMVCHQPAGPQNLRIQLSNDIKKIPKRRCKSTAIQESASLQNDNQKDSQRKAVSLYERDHFHRHDNGFQCSSVKGTCKSHICQFPDQNQVIEEQVQKLEKLQLQDSLKNKEISQRQTKERDYSFLENEDDLLTKFDVETNAQKNKKSSVIMQGQNHLNHKGANKSKFTSKESFKTSKVIIKKSKSMVKINTASLIKVGGTIKSSIVPKIAQPSLKCSTSKPVQSKNEARDSKVSLKIYKSPEQIQEKTIDIKSQVKNNDSYVQPIDSEQLPDNNHNSHQQSNQELQKNPALKKTASFDQAQASQEQVKINIKPQTLKRKTHNLDIDDYIIQEIKNQKREDVQAQPQNSFAQQISVPGANLTGQQLSYQAHQNQIYRQQDQFKKHQQNTNPQDNPVLNQSQKIDLKKQKQKPPVLPVLSYVMDQYTTEKSNNEDSSQNQQYFTLPVEPALKQTLPIDANQNVSYQNKIYPNTVNNQKVAAGNLNQEAKLGFNDQADLRIQQQQQYAQYANLGQQHRNLKDEQDYAQIDLYQKQLLKTLPTHLNQGNDKNMNRDQRPIITNSSTDLQNQVSGVAKQSLNTFTQQRIVSEDRVNTQISNQISRDYTQHQNQPNQFSQQNALNQNQKQENDMKHVQLNLAVTLGKYLVNNGISNLKAQEDQMNQLSINPSILPFPVQQSQSQSYKHKQYSQKPPSENLSKRANLNAVNTYQLPSLKFQNDEYQQAQKERQDYDQGQNMELQKSYEQAKKQYEWSHQLQNNRSQTTGMSQSNSYPKQVDVAAYSLALQKYVNLKKQSQQQQQLDQASVATQRQTHFQNKIQQKSLVQKQQNVQNVQFEHVQQHVQQQNVMHQQHLEEKLHLQQQALQANGYQNGYSIAGQNVLIVRPQQQQKNPSLPPMSLVQPPNQTQYVYEPEQAPNHGHILQGSASINPPQQTQHQLIYTSGSSSGSQVYTPQNQHNYNLHY